MGIKRIVDTSFWTDGKVDDFTPEDKYFMLYLLTNPFTTQLGIYEISIKQVAFQLGYSVDSVTALLDRFDNKYGVIIFSKETNEIAIKNFLRHSIVKGGKPVEDCLRKELKKIKNKDLIYAVFQHISNYDTLNDTVKKIINEYEIDNDNDNDNDNDVSYHDSYHDSSTNRKPSADKPKRSQFKPPTLEEVQAYCIERKNNVDAKTFYDYFTVSDWYDSKGQKVKSWKQKVITWEKNGNNQTNKSTKTSKYSYEPDDGSDLPF